MLHFGRITLTLTVIGLLHTFFGYAEESIQEKLNRAERWFEATVFEKAIHEYRELLDQLKQEEIEKWGTEITLRLAHCYFLEGQFEQVLSTLQTLDETEWDQRAYFLLGVASQRVGDYALSIDSLSQIQKSSVHVKYELGLTYYLVGNHPEASALFQEVAQTDEEYSQLAKMYLVRLALMEGAFEKAKEILMRVKQGPIEGEKESLWGQIYFQEGAFDKAIFSFEQALPKRNCTDADWFEETLYQLGCSHLCLAEKGEGAHFARATAVFHQLAQHAPSERAYLSLAECGLKQWKQLGDQEAHAQAMQLLNREELFVSLKAKEQMLLLRAEGLSNHEEKERLYRQLTDQTYQGCMGYRTSWYLRGVNAFEEGMVKRSEGHFLESTKAFERSARVMEQAFPLLIKTDPHLAGCAVKIQAQAIDLQGTSAKRAKACALLLNLLDRHHECVQALEAPDEVYYLYALIASHRKESFAKEALEVVEKGLTLYPTGVYATRLALLEGMLHLQLKNRQESLSAFRMLVEKYPQSPQAAEALFWEAHTLEEMGEDIELVRSVRRRLFQSYPDSPFAAEAYFLTYAYLDYLQGGKEAMKHLEKFPSLFPDSRFVLTANYLIGLDCKRDRKSSSGRWIRKKDLNRSILAFQQVVQAFERLSRIGAIPHEQLAEASLLAYRARLEEARVDLAIADLSQGAKRQIYLEYGEKLLIQLLEDLTKENLEHSNEIREECAFYLAKTYVKGDQDKKAEWVLAEMLGKYQAEKITRSYLLSRVWYEQGRISQRNGELQFALQCFQNASDAGKGKLLSADEKLDLWIQQSLCYSALGQKDEAMLLLSYAINCDAVSSQRLKAMFLRAEIYAAQKRDTLAQKQLKSLASKGGAWGEKAREKLEVAYGYH